MYEKPSHFHPIDELAEEFVARYRRGERPSVSEYARKYPEFADQLQGVLQAMVLLEELSPAKKENTTSNLANDGAALKHLGEYRILREIGRGGMGVVYEAEQESLGRHVALKVLPFHALMDPTSLERFRREARAAAGLHHSNIVPVFSVGEQEGVHYYAMQLIQGQALDGVLREVKRMRDVKAVECSQPLGMSNAARTLLKGGFGPLSDVSGKTPLSTSSVSSHPYFRNAARLGVQVADALAYAHSQGVLHRDIKPSNLLLDTLGTIWVTDFGLAKAGAQMELTHTGDIVGTLRYMPPERFKGWSDPRSDVYSLGLALYELVTFQPAFDESDRVRLMQQILREEPSRPRKLDRHIPHDLETIILKACAKEPGHRYPSATELAEDLRRFLDDKPIQARRSSAFEKTWRWCRRNPAVSTLTASVALLMVMVTLVSLFSAFWLRDERDATRRQLQHSLLAQARAARWSGRVGQRFDSLKALTEAVTITRDLQMDESQILELRNEAIACMALVDVALIKEWEGYPPGSECDCPFDADLQHYAPNNAQGEIKVRRVSDNRELVRLPGSGRPVQFKTFSPNGVLLVCLYQEPFGAERVNELRVWDWRQEKCIFQSDLRILGNAVAFSPDSRYLAVGQEDGTLVFYELTNGKELKRLSLGVPPWSLTFNPDGSKLAVTSLSNRNVQIVEVATGKLGRKLVNPDAVWRVAWQPGGPLLAATCLDERIVLWDAHSGRQHNVLLGHQGTAPHVTFNYGGDLLLSGSWDGTARLWNPWTGRQEASIPGGASSFSQDDRRLIIQNGGKLRLCEVARGREYRTLPPLAAGIGHAGFSPDSRYMAVGCQDGTRIWDLGTESLAVFLPGKRTIAALFAPSGKELLTSGDEGLYSRTFQAEADSILIGPAQKLVGEPMQRASLDAQGRILAVAGGKGLIFDRNDPNRKPLTLQHDNPIFVSTSPDGRWVATGTWNRRGIKVWDSTNPQSGLDLMPDALSATVAFSSDSKWLVAGTGSEFYFWRVGTWELVRRIIRDQAGGVPGQLAFSQDGTLLAIGLSSWAIQLLDAVTGKTLAMFQAPNTDPVGWIGITPDGGQLVAAYGGRSRMQIWDLRMIRERLAEMELDWDMPSYPQLVPLKLAPVQVTVETQP